ncbi:MAG: serpin family protein [Phycisphaerae bacterium]|nr:serpin family protein [Phycisphaerae bacterium]
MSESLNSRTSGKLLIAMMVIAAILANPAFGEDFGRKPKIPDFTSGKPVSTTAKTSATTIPRAANTFAIGVYRKLAAEEGNVFFSPGSIHAALSMTYAGARNRTASQMYAALGFPRTAIRKPIGSRKPRLDDIIRLDPDLSPARIKGLPKPKFGPDGGRNIVIEGPDTSIHRAYRDFLKQVYAPRQPGWTLRSANSLWGQKGYAWQKSFLAVTKDFYGAPLSEVDYVASAEGARATINAWVARETEKKILDLIAKGVLGRRTRLVLTNAVYFKGDWAEEFDKDLTKDAPFTLLSGKRVQTPMMSRKGKVRYFRNSDVSMIVLPYKGKALSMLLILPVKAGAAEMIRIRRLLCHMMIRRWLLAAVPQEIRLFMPKFTVTDSFELSKVLKELGMRDAFGSSADFSGMNGRTDLFISKVVHKAFVDVNEQGTEAAAATAVIMERKSARVLPEVRADRPFIFLIQHNQTGAILFMGRVSDPTKDK